MAYPVQLKDIIQRVRQRTNLEGAQSFVTDLEISDLVNVVTSEWYDEVRQSTWGGQYYRNRHAFQTTAGVPNGPFGIPLAALYPLPPDFLSMTSVDVVISPNTVITAQPFQEEMRNIFKWYPIGWLYSTPIYYQIWGQNIVFNPAPQSVFTVALNYVPVAPRLFAPDDKLDSINGWEEFITLGVAAKIFLKDGQMDAIAVVKQEQEQQRQRIRTMASRRDTSVAERVHQVNVDDGDEWYY